MLCSEAAFEQATAALADLFAGSVLRPGSAQHRFIRRRTAAAVRRQMNLFAGACPV